MALISSETVDQVNAISILELAERLGDNPNRRGKQYIVYCPNPNHQETKDPDTSIDPTRNIFKCFGGGSCGAGGKSSISYYSWHEFGGYEPKEHFIKAVKGIAKLMGIPIKLDNGQIISAGDTNYVPRKSAPRAEQLEPQNAAVIDKVYRAFLSLCPLNSQHEKELSEKRKYTAEEIKLHMFRSVPTAQQWVNIYNKLHGAGYPLERVPGFSQQFVPDTMEHPFPDHLVERDEELKGVWIYGPSTLDGTSYFIPVTDEFGRITRLRVRKNEGSPKYVWFSSMHNIGVEKNPLRLRRNGVTSGAPVNVVVPPKIAVSWKPGDHITDMIKVHTVLVTEGEHKSAISSKLLEITVIGVAGVGNYRELLQMIKKWGIKKFIIAYDMDTLQKEDDSIKAVKKQQNLFQTLKDFSLEVMKLNVDCYLWSWDMKDGKGLDDLLLRGMLPIEYNLTTGERRTVDIKDLEKL